MDKQSIIEQKENQIKEQRKFEAVKKNLMSPTGKLGIIVKSLGEPIIHQHEGFDELIGFTSTSIYNYHNDNEIPIMEIFDEAGNPVQEPDSPEWSARNYTRDAVTTRTIGWHFDGLSRGMNLHITYLFEENVITVEFNNNCVYRESEGILQSYIPDDNWEHKIEKLFEKAKIISQNKKNEDKQEKIKILQKQKDNWLSTLKKLWGI